MKDWYKNNYRRHLLDMHIEDWNDKFLSEFDPEEYCDNLKRAKIQCAMIYLQSHVGLCNFPTKVCREHKAFCGNGKMKALIDGCKKNNINVVAYYSLIHNNWAEINHPDWKMIEKNGKSARENGGRYGFVCPNNGKYREFLEEQIKEMAAFSEYDGVFYDMPFWPTLCRCDACKARWKKEVGGDLPDGEDTRGAQWGTYVKKLQDWMAEFCSFVAEVTKKYMPDVTIEFNNAGIVAFDWTAGSTERISDLADYTGGDLYGDPASHSFARKYFYAITKNQPFEYMNSRCLKLYEHTVTKSKERLECEIALTRAHHGANFIIDAIDPVGTTDKRVYDLLGELFAKEEKLEQYNRGKMVADAAVFFDSSAQFTAEGYSFGNKETAVAAVRKFTERHISVGVVANGHTENLSAYKCILLTGVQDFDNPEIEKFIKYAQDGGTLYFDGRSDKRLISRLLGAKEDGTVGDGRTYIAPKKRYEDVFCGFSEKYPLPFGYNLPKLILPEDAEVLATVCLPYTLPKDNFHFASIHSNPPGINTDVPAIVYRKTGKGAVIWSAAALELDEREVFGDILIGLLSFAGVKDFSVFADCSTNVETVTFKDGDTVYVNAVSIIPDKKCKYPLKLSVKTAKKPERVIELCEGKEISFCYENGRVNFSDEIAFEAAYKIQ